jgi:hypothetical protein
MYGMGTNTVENLVVTLEAKMWRSPVSATIQLVRSRFASSRLEVPLTWSEMVRLGELIGKETVFADAVSSKENRL